MWFSRATKSKQHTRLEEGTHTHTPPAHCLCLASPWIRVNAISSEQARTIWICLQEHEKLHQPGPSPSSQKPRVFNCSSCVKAFAKRSQLERHNRTHTGTEGRLNIHVSIIFSIFKKKKIKKWPVLFFQFFLKTHFSCQIKTYSNKSSYIHWIHHLAVKGLWNCWNNSTWMGWFGFVLFLLIHPALCASRLCAFVPEQL